MMRDRAAGDDLTGVIPLNHGWRFGGPAMPGSDGPDFDDSAFVRVTIPHANAVLPWRDLDRGRYQYVAIYRRPFTPPDGWRGRRVFVEFDAAMAAATVAINGHRFAEHRGGYTPFARELTGHLRWGDANILAVELDARRSRADIPPFGGRFPDGRERLDYDTFGGLHREVRLRVVPPTFIADVVARPVAALSAGRRLDLSCTLDGPTAGGAPLALEAALHDGDRTVARASAAVAPGMTRIDFALGDLGATQPWDVDDPRLYDLVVTLREADHPIHAYRTRVGFREARFASDGFYLNGRHLQLVGLNRHELFPYVGGAMPARVQRRDAAILKHELNCNIVRTSHYPQSPAFLDACDELGLLVWEELPGWQHVGGEAWRAAAVEHARAMILRDRNRPSVVLWGMRINESVEDEPALYDELQRLAKDLDPTRQTTGAYNRRAHPLRQDVWGENDYGQHGGPLGPPHKDRYLISEAVGQKRPGGGFDQFYRRADPGPTQQLQAERHAAAHAVAAADRRYAGVIAWCAFDYNSPHNAAAGVKTPGVCDLFRIPKPGAAFYRARHDPAAGFALEPTFYWDFGPLSPPDGPGPGATVFANCEHLEVYVGGVHHATVRPDRDRFAHLPHPPFTLDLTVDGRNRPELRIDGYSGGQLVISRHFSADPAGDRLLVRADDAELAGDGIDATRLTFRAIDCYGAPRPYANGAVRLELDGPGAIVGDNPFDLGPAGGSGAVWIRAAEGGVGAIRIRAAHPTLGVAEVEIAVIPPSSSPL